MFSFAPVADENLDGPLRLWNWEIASLFPQNNLKHGLLMD